MLYCKMQLIDVIEDLHVYTASKFLGDGVGSMYDTEGNAFVIE